MSIITYIIRAILISWYEEIGVKYESNDIDSFNTCIHLLFPIQTMIEIFLYMTLSSGDLFIIILILISYSVIAFPVILMLLYMLIIIRKSSIINSHLGVNLKDINKLVANIESNVKIYKESK